MSAVAPPVSPARAVLPYQVVMAVIMGSIGGIIAVLGALRDELGFADSEIGIVVTDGLEMAGIVDKYGSGEAAVRAVEAGADMVMVKPGTLFLDVIKQASQRFDVCIFAYQVSGEYAMLKIASQTGVIDWESAILESLICLKRSGASAILTYAALEVAEMII